jgi:predicted acyl esterase
LGTTPYHARRRLVAAVAALVAVCAACSGASSSRSAAAPPTTAATPVAGRPASFTAHGSVEQVWFSGAPANTPAQLYRGASDRVAEARTDAQGSLIFRNVAAGDGYRVRVGTGSDAQLTTPVRVTTPDEVPPQSFYAGQSLHDGYQYLTTRDGTSLAVMVRLPGAANAGPYPTLIEYSGYAAADPDAMQPSTELASSLGYATVAVNIRGTGCSGGAFQYFEPLQGTDGYDVVESVAAQPWVLHHRVGLIGISYPGISQLFVAQYRPPHLAAIAPLSVIDDTYRGTLYPGGILNDGFALSWAQDRQHDAQAAPASGQPWAGKRIRGGDTTCLQNQALRGQTPDIIQLLHDASWYQPLHPIVSNDFQSLPDLDSLAPATFVSKIDVPVFLAGAWQDEQVGGHFANMLDEFSSAPVKRFTLINGNHSEALTPDILVRWYEFVEFYVSERIPKLPSLFRAVAPVVLKGIFGPVQPFPPDRFTHYASFAAAKRAYEAEPSVRILFENGAGCPAVAIGAPCPTFERDYASWPISAVTPASYYLDANGSLDATAPPAGGAVSYAYAGDGQKTIYSGSQDDIWKGVPAFDWESPAPGAAASFVSAPLPQSVVMAGTGRIDLWVQANAPDVDLQVQLTEVRADGTEYYVQAGWLRASHRALDPRASNDLRAVATHKQADASPLPAGRYTEVSVELFPFAHLFHAGSRIRLIVDVPGGTRPFWKFDVLRYDHPVTVRLQTGQARITLPVLPGAAAGTPAALPPCPGLRGQPCRPYVPYTDTSG